MSSDGPESGVVDANIGPLVIHALLKGRLDPAIVAMSTALSKSAPPRARPRESLRSAPALLIPRGLHVIEGKMQTKDGTVTHESFRKAWCLRSREILLSSGEEVRDGDKARFNPENQDKLFLWWRRFNRRLRALAAEHQRSGAAPLSDAELLEVMRSSNVRYLRGSKSGPFSNRRMVEEIRALALEYGRKHGGNFVRAVAESSDASAALVLLDDQPRE